MQIIEAFASVIGDKHRIDNTENQDSCFFKREDDLLVLTVADGVGSLALSHFGSREVGHCIYNSFKKFINSNNSNFTLFLSDFISLWNSKFEDPDKYSTTCLFTILYKNTLYLGQLGDGILYYILNNNLTVLSNLDKDFSNTTVSLSTALVNDFYIKKIILKPEDRVSILMSTDGVSDSLIVDKYEQFLHYILSSIKEENDLKKRNDFLEDLLNNWQSNDDKTLGVLSLDGGIIFNE